MEIFWRNSSRAVRRGRSPGFRGGITWGWARRAGDPGGVFAGGVFFADEVFEGGVLAGRAVVAGPVTSIGGRSPTGMGVDRST